MAFEITSAHQAIFDAIEQKDGNLIISAVAGAGKTTTIVAGLERTSPRERIVFLAFNKSIATELGRRVPRHVEARTLNSLGHRCWSSHLVQAGLIKKPRDLRVDADKLTKVLYAMEDAGQLLLEDRKTYGGTACRLARIAKSMGLIHADTDTGVRGLIADRNEGWDSLISHFGIEAPEGVADHQIIDLARELLKRSTADLTTIDFDDQLYLPFAYDAKMRPYDRVFVDEAQDLSPLQHRLLAKALKRNGQLVAVGDPHQAIYGFRGADSRSMQNLRERFDCRELPLHVSYRCPKKVVAAAQNWVDHIEAHADAPDGEVDSKVLQANQADLGAADMVVCRTNAPAVALAFNLMRRRVPVQIMGRDIGRSLTTLIDRLAGASGPSRKIDISLPELLDRLATWVGKECEKEGKRKRPSETKLAAIHDKAETIEVLADGCETVDEVKQVIERLFTGTPASHKVTICSVHKSKGLEAERVWILEPKLMPHPMASSDWEREQERNLLYVAITRAQKKLGYLTLDKTDEAA
jgi:superfamily I DNA/RNA helicase